MNPHLIDGHLVLDNSSLSVIKTCGTQARYKLLEKREKVVTTAKGRGPGKALHSWFEALYGVSRGGAVNMDARDAATKALSDAYRDLQLAPGDEYLHLGRMLEVTKGYLDGVSYEMGPDGRNGKYAHPGWTGGEVFEVLGVEVPFAVRLGQVDDVPVIYIGRSDAIVRLRQQGTLMALDHKSARRWTAADCNHWRRDAGLTGYAACVSQWVNEGLATLPHPVATVMQQHEPLREQLADSGAGVKGVQGYIVNAVVIRDVSDLRRCKEPPTSYHRELYFKDDSMLDQWRVNVLQWCRTWLSWCERGEWPENETACTHHFGSLCPYYDVCLLPPGQQREIMLGTDAYQDATWSPINRATDD